MLLDGRTSATGLSAQLRANERRLMRRFGIRLRVDRISFDGKSVICSVAQVRRPFLGPRSPEKLIHLAHGALVPLHMIGFLTLVSVLPRETRPAFNPLDGNDPFGLQHALQTEA
jgi:hypothetical protein